MTKSKKGGRYTPPKPKPEAIRLLGDPALRAPNVPVERFDSELADVVAKLRRSLEAVPNGAAVAAPQIGANIQAFVWAEGEVAINPRIVNESDELWSYREGCLSIPNMWWDMERARYIDVEYYDEKGGLRRVPQMEDFQARVFQHEIDHLHGILLLDHLTDEDRDTAVRRMAAQGYSEA